MCIMDDSSSTLHSNYWFLTVNNANERKKISKGFRGPATAPVDRDAGPDRFEAKPEPRMVITAIAAVLKALYSGLFYCVPRNGDEVNEQGGSTCGLVKPLFEHFLSTRYDPCLCPHTVSGMIFCHCIICVTGVYRLLLAL
jgi:hypothetical protein